MIARNSLYALFIVLGVLSISTLTYAQLPEWKSVITYTEGQTTQFHDVVLDKAGNTIVVGTYGTTFKDGGSFIRKLNKDNVLIWEQMIPHTKIKNIDIDQHGAIYFGGQFGSFFIEIGGFKLYNSWPHVSNFVPEIFYGVKTDVFVGKINGVTGVIEWVRSNKLEIENPNRWDTKCFNDHWEGPSINPSMNHEDLSDLKCDTLGNVYVTGNYLSRAIIFDDHVAETSWGIDLLDGQGECYPDGIKDECGVGRIKSFFIAKFSQATGKADWVKTDEGNHIIPDYQSNCKVGTPFDPKPAGIYGTHLAADNKGNIYASFEFNGEDVQFGAFRMDNNDPNPAQGLVKYDKNGTVLWAKKTYAGPISYDAENAELIAASTERIGTYLGATLRLAKYHPHNGQLLKEKTFPENPLTSRLKDIVVDDSSNIYVAGSFKNQHFFEETNLKHNLPWRKPDIIGSDTCRFKSKGDMSTMVIKYDNNLDAYWGTHVPISTEDGINEPTAIKVRDGKVFIVGSFGEGGTHKFGEKLAEVGTEKHQGYLAHIDQNPVIKIHFRKIANNENTMPTHFELWGQYDNGTARETRSFTFQAKEYEEASKADARYGEFSPTLREIGQLTDLIIYNGDQLLGKVGFKYNPQNQCNGRRKEALVILHDDLVKYKDHPLEKDNDKWKFKEEYKYVYDDKVVKQKDGVSTNGGDFYQTSLFIPPGNKDKNGFLLEDESDKDLLKGTPVIMVHGYTGTDKYWGADKGNYSPDATNMDNSSDYLYTSYTARIQEKLKDSYKVWEYYYPPDQSWVESGYLLGKSLEILLKEFYTQNTKASIVVHSMGGLVTRAYIEGTAENYTAGGIASINYPYKKNIENVLFLGTPHHGSFSGNRLYWGIFLPDFVSGKIKDDYAPAARLLGVGHEAFARLNDRPHLNNHKISYFTVAGTTPKGLIPFIDDIPITTESFRNEDGAVSIASSNLLQFNIPHGLLRNFSHFHLNSPDVPDSPLSEDQKKIIPIIASEFIRTSKVSSKDKFRWDGNSNRTMEDELGFPDSKDNVKLNIVNPIITMMDTETNTIWTPRDMHLPKPIRFKVDVKSTIYIKTPFVVLNKEIVENPLNYNAPGTYLYYGANDLYNNKVWWNIASYFKDDDKKQFQEEFPSFYPYRIGLGGPWTYLPSQGNILDVIPSKRLQLITKDIDKFVHAGPKLNLDYLNPLDTQGISKIHGKGLGWHLPNLDSLDLQVYFEYTVKRRVLEFPVRFYHDSNNVIRLKRSLTTYNTINLSKDARFILNAQQHIHHHYMNYIFDLTDGDFDNLNNPSDRASFASRSRNLTEVGNHNWIDCHTHSSSFVLEYGDNPTPELQLVSPTGQIISAADEDDESIFYLHNPELNIMFFTINQPDAGKWDVLVNGQTTLPNEDYKLSFPMDVENRNSTTIRDTTTLALSGIFRDSLILETVLEDNSISTSGVRVFGDAYAGSGIPQKIEFNDDGEGADSLAGDQIFTAIFYPDSIGAYTIVTDIIGKMSGCNFIREGALDVIVLPALGSCEDLSVEVISIQKEGCESPEFVAQVQGGLAPYQYQWTANGLHSDSNFVATTDYIGTQILTVTDANGCFVKTTFEVEETLTLDAKLEYTLTDSTITFNLNNQVNVESYELQSTEIPNFMDIGSPILLPPPGRYQLCLTIANSCEEKVICTDEIIIKGNCDSLTLTLAIRQGTVPNLVANASGGTPPYMYTINGEPMVDNIFRLGCGPSTYQVEVTDKVGCTSKQSLQLPKYDPTADITYSIEEDYIQFSVENIENQGRATNLSYTDIPGGFIENQFRTAIPPPGIYYVCQEFANHCSEVLVCNRAIVIEQEDPEEEHLCENGIDQDIVFSTQEQIDRFEEYYACSDCQSIEGDLIISGQDILDISGLFFLTSVKGDLIIDNCPLLSSLVGLESITTIGGSLRIKDLDQLKSLDGLNGAAIGSIGRNLTIRNDSLLEDLSALSGLHTIEGHLLVGSNPVLPNFEGLEYLTHIGKKVIIENHQSLKDCSVLCSVLYGGTAGKTIIMKNNKAGCNNPFQILNSCGHIPSNCEDNSDFSYRQENNKIYLTAVERMEANVQYLWKVEEGTFGLSEEPTYKHVFSKPGSYKVNLKIIGSCVAGITKTIEIPDAAFLEKEPSICAIEDHDLKANFTFALLDNILAVTNTSSGQYIDTQWEGPFPIVNGQMELSTNGSFNVCLQVKDDCDRTDQFCQTISMGSACVTTLQSQESKSRVAEVSQKINNLSSTLSGIVYPNPTLGPLTVAFELVTPTTTKLSLFNISGQLIDVYLDTSLSSGKYQQELSVAHLPAGTYIIHLQTNDAVWTEKIVKIE